MVLRLKPQKGGFLRPFGCAWFIKEFLLGNSPYGSPAIDPATGAPQADIFYYYKHALIRETAIDRAVKAEERRAKKEMRDAKSITMKNGRPATQGVCPTCGTKMFRIQKKQ